ncbi:MAG: hypothetical protein ACO395_06675 [Pontimonas sp.]
MTARNALIRTAQLPNGDKLLDSGWESAGFSITRDSDTIAESNYSVAMRTLLELAGMSWQDVKHVGRPWETDDEFADHPPVGVASFNHWAHGWVDELMVRSNHPHLVAKAEELRTYVDEQYPVLDDGDYCEREWAANHPTADECRSGDPDCPCGVRQ